jgi:hypothetical protein
MGGVERAISWSDAVREQRQCRCCVCVCVCVWSRTHIAFGESFCLDVDAERGRCNVSTGAGAEELRGGG